MCYSQPIHSLVSTQYISFVVCTSEANNLSPLRSTILFNLQESPTLAPCAIPLPQPPLYPTSKSLTLPLPSNSMDPLPSNIMDKFQDLDFWLAWVVLVYLCILNLAYLQARHVRIFLRWLKYSFDPSMVDFRKKSRQGRIAKMLSVVCKLGRKKWVMEKRERQREERCKYHIESQI